MNTTFELFDLSKNFYRKSNDIDNFLKHIERRLKNKRLGFSVDIFSKIMIDISPNEDEQKKLKAIKEFYINCEKNHFKEYHSMNIFLYNSKNEIKYYISFKNDITKNRIFVDKITGFTIKRNISEELLDLLKRVYNVLWHYNEFIEIKKDDVDDLKKEVKLFIMEKSFTHEFDEENCFYLLKNISEMLSYPMLDKPFDVNYEYPFFKK